MVVGKIKGGKDKQADIKSSKAGDQYEEVAKVRQNMQGKVSQKLEIFEKKAQEAQKPCLKRKGRKVQEDEPEEKQACAEEAEEESQEDLGLSEGFSEDDDIPCLYFSTVMSLPQ